MSFAVPAVLAGISALGGLFGNRPKTQTSTSQNANTQGQTSYLSGGTQGSTNIALNPLAGQGYEAIAKKYMDLINNDPNLTGYQAKAGSDINDLAQIQSANAQENLAGRGISGPAVGTAVNNVESQRVRSLTDLNNSIPLLSRQLLETTLGNAGSFYRGIPTDTYTSSNTGTTTGSSGYSTTNATGSQTDPGNQLGGLFGGAGNILALLYGMGAFGQNQPNSSQRTNGYPNNGVGSTGGV